MYLVDHDTENCLFKILPHYKVGPVDYEVHLWYTYITSKCFFFKVQIEDQVIFESEQNVGQYVHTSSNTCHQVGIALHENKYIYVYIYVYL